MMKKLQQKLREGREQLVNIDNYEIFEYYGVLCLLVPNEEENGLQLTYEVALVKNSESEEFSEEDVKVLCEKEVITEFDIKEFEEFMYASYKRYQEQFSSIIPFIHCLMYGIDEDSSEDEKLDTISKILEEGDYDGLKTGIGFRISDRVF